MTQTDSAAKTAKRPDPSQTDEPAKGGLKPADPKAHPSGDSPKAQGDKLQHAVDKAAERPEKKKN
jgi:hypothetical protein